MEDKGEWAETADEGIVPPELGSDEDSPEVGRTTGDDEPATAEGIDLGAGDAADAVTDGGPKPPDGEEPDLKDVGAAPRRVDRA
jgi:hypothetical protein